MQGVLKLAAFDKNIQLTRFFKIIRFERKRLTLPPVRVCLILNKFQAALVTEKERPIMLIKTLCEGYEFFF